MLVRLATWITASAEGPIIPYVANTSVSPIDQPLSLNTTGSPVLTTLLYRPKSLTNNSLNVAWNGCVLSLTMYIISATSSNPLAIKVAKAAPDTPRRGKAPTP